MQYSSSGNEITNIYSDSESLVIEKKITKICSESSKSIGSLKILSFEEGSELVTLEKSAFRYGKYTSISLTNCKKLQCLPTWCFRDCYSLSSISFPEDGILKTIDQGAFANTVITHLKIPSSVEELADCTMDYGAVFHCCYKLVSVTFLENSKCKKLGKLAFWICKSLTEFVVPPLVKMITIKLFHECKSLTRIVILAKEISVGDVPFNGIENTIKKVYVCSLQAKNALKKSGITRDKIVLLNKYSSRCQSRGHILPFTIIALIVNIK